MDVDIPPKYDTSGDNMHRKFLNGYLNGGYLITEGDKEINGDTQHYDLLRKRINPKTNS